jgi:tetratricopeptide (TPR) repeat protein
MNTIAFSILFLFYSSIQGQEGTNLANVANRIDDYLTKSTYNGYSGSVLIAKDGEIILSKGYGWAIFNASDKNKIVTHNGSNGIYFADFIRYIEDDIVVIALSNIILNQQSENVGWVISKMITDVNFEPPIIPKNSYELVFDFIRTHPPNKASQLPQFIETNTGESIQDKAILNRIGFKQISERKNVDWGIALLQQNVRLFPDDGNLWDTLGEGYYLLNNKDSAIESFKKAMELKPESDCYWCENSKNRLSELLNR